MATAITCRECGFLYAFKKDGVEFQGRLCPQCQAYAAMVEVDVDLPGEAIPEAQYWWFVVDRIGTPKSGPFAGEGDGYRWIIRDHLQSDDYPRDSLAVSFLPIPPDFAPRSAASGDIVARLRASLVSSVTPRGLDRLRVESAGDAAFWTPDRVIALAHLDVAAS